MMGIFGPPNIEKMKAKKNVKGLIKALSYKKDSRVRSAASRALVKFGDPCVVEPLIAALEHDVSSDVREAVAKTLAKIGSPAVEPLIATLKDKSSYVRVHAAKTLGKIGDTRAVGPLIDALKDEDPDVRMVAPEALVKIGAPAVEPLVASLKDADHGTDKAVIGMLSKIGGPAIEALTTIQKDEDEELRKVATGALKKINKDVSKLIGIIGNIWADEKTRKAAALRLAGIGKPAIEPLITLFNHREIVVRETAVKVLRNMKIQLPSKTATLLESASVRYSKELETIEKEIKPLTSLLLSGYSWAEKKGFPIHEKYPQYEEIRKIGKRIHQIGGHSGMWIPYYHFLYNIRWVAGILENMWHGIGTWRR